MASQMKMTKVLIGVAIAVCMVLVFLPLVSLQANAIVGSAVNVSGSITWDDDDNRDGIRPENVTVTLYADGVATEQVTVVGEAENWTYSFAELPEINSDSEENISYSVVIDEVEGYEFTEDTDNQWSYTAKHEIATVTTQGSITWDDDSNRDGIRPESLSLTLSNGNVAVETIEVSATDSWSYAFSSVPKYENGVEIIYTVCLTNDITGYTTSQSEGAITLSHTPEMITVSGSIIWDDDNDRDGYRPYETLVYFYNGNNEQVASEYVYSSESTYSQEFYKYENGELAVYTVSSNDTDVYTYTQEEGSYNLKGYHAPYKKDVTVTVLWEDSEILGISERPEGDLSMWFTADGVKVQEIILNSENGYTAVVPDLFCYTGGMWIDYGLTDITETENYRADCSAVDDSQTSGTLVLRMTHKSIYDVFVGDIRVTDENKNDVLGSSDEGATVKYDSKTNTLILNNAELTETYRYLFEDSAEEFGIYSMSDLNISLVGENNISLKTNDADYISGIYSDTNIVINGEGSLNIEIEYTDEYYGEIYGIYAYDDCTIEDCTISVNIDAAGYYLCGIDVIDNLYITNCNIDITLGDAAALYAVYADDDICVEDSSISITTGTGYYYNYGIESDDGDVLISKSDIHIVLGNSAADEEDGSSSVKGIHAEEENLTVTDSDIVVTTGDGLFLYNIGIDVDSEGIFKNSNVTLNIGSSYCYSRGFEMDDGNLSFTDCNVSILVGDCTTEEAFDTPEVYGIYLDEGDMSFTGGKININVGNAEGYYGVNVFGISAEHDSYEDGYVGGKLTIKDAEVTIITGNATNVSCDENGAKVFGINTDDVFTLEGSKLTMHIGDATVKETDDAYIYGICARGFDSRESDVGILTGDAWACDEYAYIFGVCVWEDDCNVSGGRLQIETGNAYNNYCCEAENYGICVNDGDLNVTDGAKLYIDLGSACDYCGYSYVCGISVYGYSSIDGDTYEGGSITVNNGFISVYMGHGEYMIGIEALCDIRFINATVTVDCYSAVYSNSGTIYLSDNLSLYNMYEPVTNEDGDIIELQRYDSYEPARIAEHHEIVYFVGTTSAKNDTIFAVCTDEFFDGSFCDEELGYVKIIIPESTRFTGKPIAAVIENTLQTSDLVEVTYVSHTDASFSGIPTLPGTYTVRISVGGRSISASYVIAVEDTEAVLTGDVTGDGKVNMADVVAIRRYLVNATEYPLNVAAAGDVNGDGKVNMADVVAIRRYLVNATEYPLVKNKA